MSRSGFQYVILRQVLPGSCYPVSEQMGLDQANLFRSMSAASALADHICLWPVTRYPRAVSTAILASENLPPVAELHRIMVEPGSGPHRSRPASTGVTAEKADKEKRKRSRVTPEQLVHLERFFSIDRSPTAARRKEISDTLGMQERQTQIWFQNRSVSASLRDPAPNRLADEPRLNYKTVRNIGLAMQKRHQTRHQD